MESKSEKWQLKRIGTMSFINDECDNLKQSDKAFFENIIRDIFSDVITDFKELEGAIENMKAISLPKEEVVNGITSVDYPSDNETEIDSKYQRDYNTTIYSCKKCNTQILRTNYNYCPNCGRKIKK